MPHQRIPKVLNAVDRLLIEVGHVLVLPHVYQDLEVLSQRRFFPVIFHELEHFRNYHNHTVDTNAQVKVGGAEQYLSRIGTFDVEPSPAIVQIHEQEVRDDARKRNDTHNQPCD